MNTVSMVVAKDRVSAAFPEVAGFLHDMRSPLGAIAFYNDLLQDTRSDDEERSTYHQAIAAQVRRLSDMADMLEQTAAVHRTQAVDLHAVLVAMVGLYTARHGHHGYRFDLDLAPVLPVIHANATALERVLDNLLSNAVKYCRPHRITVRAKVDSGQEVIVEVEDRGPGIAGKHKQRLARPYYRATDRCEGYGLGLAIAKKLIQHHSGQLEIDDTPGGGTTVRIRLPQTKTSCYDASCTH